MDRRTIDALIKIKNGCMARKDSILVFRSFEVSLVLDFLLKHYYIATYSPYDRVHYAVKLRYLSTGKSVINTINVISYPNRPIYMTFKDIKKNFYANPNSLSLFRAACPYNTLYLKNGIGIDMVTTKKTGILELEEIMKRRIGAEVLLTVN